LLDRGAMCIISSAMTKGGSISVPVVRGYLELARAQGLDVDAILRENGKPDLLANFDGRVGWEDCERIAAAIEGRIGIPNMVRTMTAAFQGNGFGVLYYVARHSKTVGSALRRVAEHYHVTSTLARSELVETPNVARLDLIQQDYVSGGFRQVISALWSTSNIAVLRQLLGTKMHPESVGLEMPRPERAEDVDVLETAVGCSIDFDSRVSTIALDPAILAESVVNPDPIVEAAMLRYIEDVNSRFVGDGTTSRVRQAILGALQSGEPALDTVAQKVGTSPRTLQRRLRDEATSFQQVLDEVRREAALTHMRSRRATIDEVAFMLGFEKPSSFHRAFKRWTGLTPGEFRRQSMAPTS
jgi:AraC-like DNA-binding protein